MKRMLDYGVFKNTVAVKMAGVDRIARQRFGLRQSSAALDRQAQR